MKTILLKTRSLIDYKICLNNDKISDENYQT
jgi:hypothetical protein